MSNVHEIGLIGWGTVGGGIVEVLREEQESIAKRCGVQLTLRHIADKDFEKKKGAWIPEGCRLDDNSDALIANEDIQTVMLLVPGTGVSRELCLKCLKAGKNVVTANKALVAEYWDELVAAADANNVSLSFESAVGGTIPIIDTVRDSFAANRIDAVHGILNGTCNYILTMMEEEQLSYDQALKQAQELGYAEFDPTFDVNGKDTAHKICILARMAFNTAVFFSDVSCTGIEQITAGDIRSAKELDSRIKLLGIARRCENGIKVSVAPTLVSLSHPLASVRLNFNAVNVDASAAGPNMLIGQGAGARPTASAVLSDVIAIATGARALCGPRAHGKVLYDIPVVTDHSERVSYYLRLTVPDKPGTLASICKCFSNSKISIQSVNQAPPDDLDHPIIEIITHPCHGSAFQECVKDISQVVTLADKPVILEKL